MKTLLLHTPSGEEIGFCFGPGSVILPYCGCTNLYKDGKLYSPTQVRETVAEIAEMLNRDEGK